MNEQSGTAAFGRLTVMLQGEVVHTIDLTMPVLTIGRGPHSGLPLPADLFISQDHAELRQTPEGTVLTDLESSNGTVIGGVKIRPNLPYLLPNGVSFVIGLHEFLYELVVEEAPARRDPTPVPAAAGGRAGEAEGAERAEGERSPEADGVQAAVGAPEVRPPDPPRAEARRPMALPPPTPPPAPRLASPAPIPPGPRSNYLDNLPVVFQDSDFLGRFLLVEEAIWEPLEQRQDHIHAYFDPATCPPAFLPWLASWLDPALEQPWPAGRLRAVLARASDIARWRGTRYGMALLIELCTGLAPSVTEDPGAPFCFSVRIEVPPGSDVDRRLIERLILAQKPAHAGYFLEMVEGVGDAA